MQTKQVTYDETTGILITSLVLGEWSERVTVETVEEQSEDVGE